MKRYKQVLDEVLMISAKPKAEVDNTHRKKSKTNFPRKLLIKKYIPTDLGQKKKNMPKENLCRYKKTQPFNKNYEVNDKSRLEIKHDFFNLNMIHE